MNETERKQSIVNRLEKKYSRFYKNIDLEKIMVSLDMKSFISVRLVFNYWKLKRRMNVPANKALIYPRNVDDLMSQTENILTIRMNMFMHLRYGLNLTNFLPTNHFLWYAALTLAKIELLYPKNAGA